ncbi:GMP synthase-Glutamine amidotransferase [Jatrophihabitans endophyticus]|uniref:GMP synthase-Glutamine amidotransferase n=1 Tax=Jatrophihabitans endophyticus TaxID=1206085 RepID=A0A1M5KW28_9ACTN|nr:type 1 glutamine amidotransferase [Jatrophihabitans endophyticus]SHG56880.1 GMP synthase-Glutamine amidotransferase [Jatrophihabitans endophyticus]
MDAPRVVMVELDHSDPPGRLRDWLVAAGLEVVVCDVAGGESLPAPGGYAGLVVLGGKMGAGDDAEYPFLADVRQLLRDVVRDEVPTLAICLGAQLLAAAHGGRVVVNPEGPEIGAQLVAKRAAAATDPLFGAMPITPDVMQWHYDTVASLPPGAIHLASSPVCENQAFRVGRLAWAVQFHIETTPEMVAEWARADAPNLPELDLDLVVSRAAAAHDDIAEVWAPFAQAFAAVVGDPSAVAPPRGVATATAAPVTDPAAIRAALAAEAGAARGTDALPSPLPMPTRRPPGD